MTELIDLAAIVFCLGGAYRLCLLWSKPPRAVDEVERSPLHRVARALEKDRP